MDVLSQALGELRVASSVYCAFDVAQEHGVAYPAGRTAGFHVVLDGALELARRGARPLALRRGDFVVLPHGAEHRLQAGRAARVEEVGIVARRAADGVARVGRGARVARYVCGAFTFRTPGEHPLLAALPAVLRVRAEEGEELPWLETHLEAMACEARSGRPGADAVIARLSEILLVHAIRAHVRALPADAPGWFGAVRDPQLGRAMAAMHRHPERPWTVAALAGEAGLSRSQFAERFSATIGRPPLSYLAEWRMQLGRSLLQEGVLRVGEVARRVGYGSEGAFSTAFRRAAGVAPSVYRKAGSAG